MSIEHHHVKYSNLISPFPFLEVNHRMWNKTPMPGTCDPANSGCFQFVSHGIGLSHGSMIVASRFRGGVASYLQVTLIFLPSDHESGTICEPNLVLQIGHVQMFSLEISIHDK
jgi:hypothetical protein